MKIGFYVNNSQFPDVDCRNVIEGNPGIGGTWHIVLLVSSQLALRTNDLDITLYAQVPGLLPNGPAIDYVANQEQSIYKADSDGCDYIVLNYGGFDWKGFNFETIKTKLKIIVWSHNLCSLDDLSLLYRESSIAKIITVSREQMDLYRDHPAFSKMDYIFNCVPCPDSYEEKASKNPYGSREHNVVYLASLVPVKSFHILADVWPYILRQVPDANLYVIGSGKTYYKDAELGSRGIASQEYESRFLPPIMEPNGDIIKSVHFVGNLGVEKNDYLLKAKVGVPSLCSIETFCISAVEMQYLGCAVTAMSAPGYYDTFVNGIITKYSKRAFANSIIKLLKSNSPVVPYNDTIEKIQKAFSVESVITEWEALFAGDMNKHLHPIVPLNNKYYRYKWLKEYKRRIKCNWPVVESILAISDAIQKKIHSL